MSLKTSEKNSEKHELDNIFSLRRSIGIWKIIYYSKDKIEYSRETKGKYLVETLAHCSECHTSRTLLGGLDLNRYLAGAKTIKNNGAAPNITPHITGLKNWTVEDIVNYLESGFTPDFDSAGGQMVSVISNLSKVPKEDLINIARYLKSIPPIPSN